MLRRRVCLWGIVGGRERVIVGDGDTRGLGEGVLGEDVDVLDVRVDPGD